MSANAPKWIIAHTRPNCEFLAAYHLRRQGFRVWHWHRQAQENVKRSGKLVTLRWAESFFSRYVFVRDSKRVQKINETTGVSTILYGDAGPLMVPDPDLRWLAEDLGMAEDGCIPDRPLKDYPILPKGTRFKVKDGPFMSFLATVKDAVPLDHSTRFKAYIQIFGRSTEAELGQEQIGEVVNG